MVSATRTGQVFAGSRNPDGRAVVLVRKPDEWGKPLPQRQDLANHSPDGFEWGYGGSGPAQLALAMCAYATGDDELALSVYQRFKREIIVPLKGYDIWQLDIEAVAQFALDLRPVRVAH